jgi:AdoMet-dependent heme synthase
MDVTISKRQPAIGPLPRFTFDRAPMLIYWEATRACDLACIHCRAEAVALRHPLELKTAEVQALLHQIAGFGGPHLPHLVVTGGDPLNRPDLHELIRHACSLGIPVSVTPAGTPKLTEVAIRGLREAGASGLGLSLDGSDSARHDAFRGEPGSFDWTVNGIRSARSLGLPVQANTMVTAETLDDIPAIYELMRALDISRWALFFLIATGRGASLRSLQPVESERFLNWLWQQAPTAPFPIKTTEAHHYRRIAYLKLQRRGVSPQQILELPVGRGFGIRDGNGIVFVSHTGDIYPSGFLPLAAGNVRRDDLVAVYRHGELFRRLRDPDQLQGKCGRCEFRALCGGSRARAYAESGDPLAADSLCPYEPRERGLHSHSEP